MVDEAYNVAFPMWICSLIVIPSSVIGKLMCCKCPQLRVLVIIVSSATEGDATNKEK